MLACAVVLPLALFVVLTLHDRSHAREQAIRLLSLANELSREQALRVVQAGLHAIDRAEDVAGSATWAQLQARRTAVQAELRRVEQGQPDDLALALVRPDGRVAAAGRPEVPVLGDLSALDALRTLRGGARGPVFDTAPTDLFGETAGLLIARGRAPDGRPFDGAVVAVARADAFIVERGAAGPGAGRFALVRADGTVLLRQGGAAGAPVAAVPRSAPHPAVVEGDPWLTGADPFGDGAPQLASWLRLGTHPLYVVRTLPLDSVRAAADSMHALNGALAAALAVALLLAAWRIRRAARDGVGTLQRLEANAAELRAEIARREVAEENLRNAQRMEGLGRLTGGVAHDFNNLLTAILGTARALERHLGPRADERTRRLIAATVAAVDRGARLNASLLAFARRQPLTLTTVDANALLRDFLPLLRRALDESVTVELALDQKLPACSADAAQLEAALLNLAINARDAMPRGGKLRIVTRRAWLQEQALAGNTEAQPGPYVAIEVRDTGQGMAPEVRERAFEPFFTTKGPGQGTGLGLSQVFGFVRQIGGHVAIQSAPGRGTAVTLYLPLGSATENAVGGTAPAPRPPAHSGVGYSVLVVEDEPAVRAVAVDMLQDAGFAVLAAPDGPTALALLREGAQADILFSDVVMPGGMTGVDLAQEARRLRPGIGVLLASGYAAEALAEHGGAGEFELIGKPYDVDTVLTRIAAQRPQRAVPAA
jgi:signal transduction histidine kinase/CheY-like chemotaxis protein